MLRGLSAPALVLSGALLLTGCSNMNLGTSSSSTSPTALPANTSCSAGGNGSSTKAPTNSAGVSAGLLVHGSCTVVAAPDTATVTTLVQVQAVTARSALDQTTGKADAVVGGLKGKGVSPQDIRGGSLVVTPVFSPVITSITGVGGTRVTGFIASKSITAVLHDVTTAGSVISSVIDTAGDSGQVQVSYSVGDDSALRAQARAAAIRSAQDSAKSMADAAGEALGQLISINDVTAVASPTLPAGQSASSTSSTPPGMSLSDLKDDGQALTASVDLVYAVG
jgi:hypothetical protein